MNNREYLNTLSDEEASRKTINKIREFLKQTTSYDNEIVNQELIDKYMYWLQAEHETTADEDFAEIGFKLYDKDSTSYEYADMNDRHILVGLNGNKYTIESDDNGICFADVTIDQIRTIADKKRKEMGWDK